MSTLDHDVRIFEPAQAWSVHNLREEVRGDASLEQFHATYPELQVNTYPPESGLDFWRVYLCGVNVVILHEWTTPELARVMLSLRPQMGFALLFHDTHHRALSSPKDLERLAIRDFDGVIGFGEVLREVYRTAFSITRFWVLHEAADVTVFMPKPSLHIEQDLVWVGNWGDDERSAEIREFILTPAAELPDLSATVYGVRYPSTGLLALEQSDVRYGGYLPNLEAPFIYSRSRLTVHIPRRYYATAMVGIPTIRIFEALACGIPLISAPWQDTERLFRQEDFTLVENGQGMKSAIKGFLNDPAPFIAKAQRGLETVLTRHTCEHRALELVSICQEVLQ